MAYCDPPEEYQFKKGESGNPKGRPKGSGIRQWMKIIANEIDPETGKTHGQVLAEKLHKMAKRGHTKAIDVIVDGVDGKLTQSVQVEPVNIKFTYTDKDDES